MVDIVQWLERQIVVLNVVGSSPTIHPTSINVILKQGINAFFIPSSNPFIPTHKQKATKVFAVISTHMLMPIVQLSMSNNHNLQNGITAQATSYR